jgi:hypothetical protein
MKEKLKFLWINLTQFIVYYDRPNVCNAVVAIGHSEKELLIIRPEYRNEQQNIIKAINFHGAPEFTVLYGDGFGVDTWNNKIKDYNPDTADHKYLPEGAVVVNP